MFEPPRPSRGLRWDDVSPSLRRKVADFSLQRPRFHMVDIGLCHAGFDLDIAHGKLCVLIDGEVFVFDLKRGCREYRWPVQHAAARTRMFLVQQSKGQTPIALRCGRVFTMHAWNGQLLRRVEVDLLAGLMSTVVTDTSLVLAYQDNIHVMCAYTGRLQSVFAHATMGKMMADAQGFATYDPWSNRLTALNWDGTIGYTGALDSPCSHKRFLLKAMTDRVLVLTSMMVRKNIVPVVRRVDGVIVSLWDLPQVGWFHVDPSACVYGVTAHHVTSPNEPAQMWTSRHYTTCIK